jgi:hypothetical protein
MNQQNSLGLVERLSAPTPQLFAIIRNIGLLLAAIAGGIAYLTSNGMVLPEWAVAVGEKAYVLAGAVAALVAQLTVDFKKLDAQKRLDGIGFPPMPRA